ncbi:MAG TPA: response regulator [Edaphobacter sp.]|nr:response regulator [Edaphobacter sp.]
MRILLVEDEIKVGDALKKGLQAEEYEVTWAQTGEEGFFHASSQLFDLIVLDVMLPGRGWDRGAANVAQAGIQNTCSSPDRERRH